MILNASKSDSSKQLQTGNCRTGYVYYVILWRLAYRRVSHQALGLGLVAGLSLVLHVATRTDGSKIELHPGSEIR